MTKVLVINMLMWCAPFFEIFEQGEFTPCQPNVSRLIIKFMIQTWKIKKDEAEEIKLPDKSSLDAITRQLPDGYYSTFRTFDGCTRVIGLTAHLRRLPDIDASALRRNLLSLLKPYQPGETRVRVMLTKRGELYISVEPLKLLAREIYEKGVRVETTTIHRNDPRVKSTAFIGASDGERKHIAQLGVFEALLVKNGRILEGMTSNFFYMVGNMLYTARNDILLGITRTMVIRAARGRGVELRYRPLKLDQLPAVKEAFITSSSRGIVPVVQIDDIKVERGRVGLTTKMLMKAYEEYVRKHAEKI
jgi:branched-chain amino acid aminotransferase